VTDKNSQIKAFKSYIKIKTSYEDRVMGVKNLKSLYINKSINIPDLSKLAKFVNIYIIENDGSIVEKIDAKI